MKKIDQKISCYCSFKELKNTITTSYGSFKEIKNTITTITIIGDKQFNVITFHILKLEK